MAGVNTASGSAPVSSGLVRYATTATGAVARTVKAKLDETVSVRDFGALGNGVADDLAALKAASDHACAYGCDLVVPSGIYRVTGSWVIGGGIIQTVANSVAGTISFDSAAADAVKAKHRPVIRAEPGAAVWGDFTPGALTAIVDYQLGTASASPCDTGGVHGLTILGKAGWQSGALHDPPGDDARTGVLQVGLHALAGCRVTDRLRLRELRYGLVAPAAYWTDHRAVWAWRCGKAVKLPDFNAGRINQLVMQYCDVGLDVDGASFTASDIHTEQVLEDLIITAAECARLGPAYFEDASAVANGSGKYAVRLGVDGDASTQRIIATTFFGIRVGAVRADKRAFRAQNMGTGCLFQNCRDFGHGFDTSGTVIVGHIMDCSFTSFGTPLDMNKWCIEAGANLRGVLGSVGSDRNGTGLYFFIFPFDSTNFQSIAAGDVAGHDFTLPTTLPDYDYGIASVHITGGGNYSCVHTATVKNATTATIRVTNATSSPQSSSFSAIIRVELLN